MKAYKCEGQMDIFDFLGQETQEYRNGEWIEHHGKLLLPEDFTGQNAKCTIGTQIVIDKSTESREWYKVARIEAITTRKDTAWEAKRIVLYDGTHQRALCDVSEIQKDHNMMHHSVFTRLYELPEKKRTGKINYKRYPAALVGTCPECNSEMFRKVISKNGDYETLNIKNCRRCGLIAEG